MTTRWLAVAGIVISAVLISNCAARRNYAHRVDTPHWGDFDARVSKYVSMVDALEKDLSPLSAQSTPEQIASHKKALAQAIRKSRANARQGEIFAADLKPRFVSVIRGEVRGKEGKAAKTAVAEDNPAKPNHEGPPVRLAVNAAYPDGAALSTVPPTILLQLPALPDAVDYRFVGKALVLHDVRSGLIVDYIPGAGL